MKYVSIVLAMALSFAAHAEDSSQPNSNSATLKETQLDAKPAPSKDIDDEITNARLRAVTGAKSAWSLWSQFLYYGSSIETPFSTYRPQLNTQNAADPTNLAGQISAKYRITEHQAVLAGIGVQYTPAYTSQGQDNAAQVTAQSPYVDYEVAIKAGGIQNVFDVSVSKYTLASDISNNLNYNWAIQHQGMWQIPTTKFELGAATGVTQDIYTNLDPGQAKNTIFFQAFCEPILEYAFTEKASFRTVYRMWIYSQNASDRSWSEAAQTESAGIGYALTRDVYLYPNVQWSWQFPREDMTTVGMQANINLF